MQVLGISEQIRDMVGEKVAFGSFWAEKAWGWAESGEEECSG